MFYHWKIILSPEEDAVNSWFINPKIEHLFQNLLKQNSSNRVNVDWGKETFKYEAALGEKSRISEQVPVSIWRITIYGGLSIEGSEKASLWGITCNKKLMQELKTSISER